MGCRFSCMIRMPLVSDSTSISALLIFRHFLLSHVTWSVCSFEHLFHNSWVSLPIFVVGLMRFIVQLDFLFPPCKVFPIANKMAELVLRILRDFLLNMWLQNYNEWNKTINYHVAWPKCMLRGQKSLCITQRPGEYRINCISLLILSILHSLGST